MDGIKVKALKELPLLVRRQQRVLHELLEGLETLDVNANCVFVALFGTVKGILLGVTYTPEITHGSFKSSVGGLLPGGGIFLLSSLVTSCANAQLGLAFMTRATVVYKMCRIAFAEGSKCFVIAALFYKAMASEIATRGAALDEFLFEEKCVGTSVIASSKVDLCQPESITIVV